MGLGKYDRFTLVGRLFHLCRTLVPLKSDARPTLVIRLFCYNRTTTG